MKKSLLLFAAMAAVAITAAAQSKVLSGEQSYSYYKWSSETMSYEQTDEPQMYDNPTSYFYDAAGRLAFLVRGSSQTRYTYNADGTVASTQRWANSANGFVCASEVQYTYDAAGKVTKERTETNGYVSGNIYSGFDDKGNYTVKQSFSDANETVSSEERYEYVYNADGTTAERVTKSQDWNDKTLFNESSKVVYEYAEGRLAKEDMYYFSNGEYSLSSTKTYVYNEDGSLKQRIENNSQNHPVYYDFTYVAHNAANIVNGVEAIYMTGTVNRVYITWNKVDAAESYIIVCDGNLFTVEAGGECEYLTKTLMDGTHHITVAAVVGGETQCVGDFKTVDVKDTSIQPCTNFRVTGITCETNEWGWTMYHVSYEWDKPVTIGEITKYIIYVDKGDSWISNNTVNDPEATSAVIDYSKNSFQYQDENWNLLPEGPDCKIYIVAVYPTGQSEPSNVIEMNLYNEFSKVDGTADAISDVNAASAKAEYYNLSGVRLNNADAQRGVVIMRQNGRAVKVVK